VDILVILKSAWSGGSFPNLGAAVPPVKPSGQWRMAKPIARLLEGVRWAG
jgi:hypothetical protein